MKQFFHEKTNKRGSVSRIKNIKFKLIDGEVRLTHNIMLNFSKIERLRDEETAKKL